MTKKIMLLAVSAVAVLAFAAMPALASAATPEMDNFTGFTGTSGVSTLKTPKHTVTCKKDKNTGTFTSKTAGTVEITFEECESSGFKCNTSGQAAGVITTATLPFDLVYLEATTKPGILVTPPAGGTFVSFECTVLVKTVVTGNGVLGEITSPACGATGNAFNVTFSETAGKQTWTQIETAGTAFGEIATINGTAEAGVQTGVETGKFNGGATPTLTCP
jgi:hypothetical protein